MADQTGWITSLGDNSCSISYPAGAAIADLLDTVENWIDDHGWEEYDAAAGTNARAFRAINLDASTYKYIVIDGNSAGYFYLKVYESWNSGTHAGTNLAYFSGTAANGSRVDLTNGGTLYIFAKATHLIFFSSIAAGIGSSTGNSFASCLEVTRDNADDTVGAGYPCWGFVNGFLLGGGNYGNYIWSSPRLRDGTTTTNASNYTFASVPLALSGYAGPSGCYNMFSFATGGVRAGGVTTIVNGWNSKNWAFPITVGKINTAGDTLSATPEVKGRLLGIKLITKGAGAFGDTISIDIDSNGFPDPSGTATEHWVLSDNLGGRYAVVK